MAEDLLDVVVRELQARKGTWADIARAVPSVSYSWVAAIGSGTYGSSPSYRRLRALADYFQANPLPPAPQSASHSTTHTATDTVAGTTTA